jgi:peptidoglycan/LPS O-acetylase OafA/YrhL
LGTLRILLAVAVLASHLPFGLPGFQFVEGATAVQGFFVISGFFITLVLCENPAYQDPLRFYCSRYLRLWPIYFVCAVPTVFLSSYNVFSFADQNVTYAEAFKHLDWLGKFYVLFSNLTMFFQEWSLFLQADWQTGALSFTSDFNAGTKPIVYRLLWDVPAWSLSIELLFYLIAPFVVRSHIRVIWLTAASLSIRIFTARHFPLMDPWGSRFVPSELCMFGLGSIAYHFHRKVIPWAPAAIRRSMMTVAGIVGMSFLIVAIVFHAGGSGLWRSSQAVLVYSPLFLLVIATFVGPIFALTRSSKLDRWLGDMSYPIYLCHLPVFSAMTFIGLQASPANSAVGLLATLFISAALLWLIDAPVSRFRKSQLYAQQTFMPALRPAE